MKTSANPPSSSNSFARKTAVTQVAAAVFGLWVLGSVLLHRLPHNASDRTGAPVLEGAQIEPSVSEVFNHACIDCHSEKTKWPWYSNLAPASWFIEGDVQRARSLMNLSRWDSLGTTDQRALLTAIATVIENREMPPHRYVMVHPHARLSPEDSVRVIEWTRAERRRLRAAIDTANTQ